MGRPDFIYVADSKLCVTATMTHINGQGGHFVTVLPATRKEEGWFWVQSPMGSGPEGDRGGLRLPPCRAGKLVYHNQRVRQ